VGKGELMAVGRIGRRRTAETYERVMVYEGF